ncbi:GNAT family N-acetyltransferase [Cohnella faecalis]|uniref:GNAT family N-acetyltransferase n=1 Tax=Cohnella faecalis TaxID=2315694 RepID=A0A398CY02_9BACL|nr:GNAT family N-acetyltransferase [Cohnella faecalis]
MDPRCSDENGRSRERIQLADARRQGGVTKLLHHALRKMREAGQTISMLHPFSVPFTANTGMS